jgi:hypothetical protein
LLHKLLIEEQTKSRSNRSNDNAQAESKNASIVRKHFGYSHIPQRFAPLVNDFCRAHLNPYINFHRPCLFAHTIIDKKGRQRKRYPYSLMMTPYEKLKSLPNAEQYLKPSVSFSQLDALAAAISDNDAATHLNDAKTRLFKVFLQPINISSLKPRHYPRSDSYLDWNGLPISIILGIFYRRSWHE